MRVFQILNIADLAFMAAGIAAALVMIIVGARDGRRDMREEEGPAAQLRTRRPR